MNQRGQLAVFVILAIVIVGVVAVFLFVSSDVTFFSQEVNPSSFLRDCIEPHVSEVKNVLSLQGGYFEPTHPASHQGKKIQYLCYTSENYKPCVIQQPMLIEHIESEMKSFIQPKARECVNNLKGEYESRGFSVQSTPREVEVDIVTGSIAVTFLSPMAISRDGNVQKFERFGVAVKSEWYDLLSTSLSILSFESVLGDSETNVYLNYYPDLKIEKFRQGDGSTIYKLSNVLTDDEFTFATRSLVWPAGYEL